MNRFGSYRLCSVGVAVLCALVAVGQAQGQEQSPAAKSKPGVKAKPTVSTKATPTAKGESPLNPKASRVAKPGVKGPRAAAKKPKRKGGVKFDMNPDAKWACDVLSVTRDPVWKKSKSLTFDFKIRNEGTADLKIAGKGG